MNINKELLLKAAKMAEADYKHFDMQTWRVKVTQSLKDRWERTKYTRGKNLECGTVCCLAGNICSVALGAKAFALMNEDAISSTAAGLAGLDQVEASNLFSPGGSFYESSRRLKPGTRPYGKAIANGVRAFVEQKEQEAA